MFSQKKKFYEKRSFYIGLLAVLVAFGIWINNTPGEAVGEDDLLLSQTGENDTGENGVSGADAETNTSRTPQQGQQSGRKPEPAEGADREAERIYPAVSDEYEEDTLQEMDFNSLEDDYSQWADYPYYLIREDDGKILVYYYDLMGQQSLVRTTSIAFNLLSETDQKLFREGIRKETEEEMMDLLQDFES